MLPLRLLGVLGLRLAERRYVPSRYQDPPRMTRSAPPALPVAPAAARYEDWCHHEWRRQGDFDEM